LSIFFFFSQIPSFIFSLFSCGQKVALTMFVYHSLRRFLAIIDSRTLQTLQHTIWAGKTDNVEETGGGCGADISSASGSIIWGRKWGTGAAVV
jgi:hypothetical protein